MQELIDLCTCMRDLFSSLSFEGPKALLFFKVQVPVYPRYMTKLTYRAQHSWKTIEGSEAIQSFELIETKMGEGDTNGEE